MPYTDPILDEIYRLSQDRRNGTLILGQEKNTIEIHFLDGKIGAASSNIPQLQLGRYLIKSRLLREFSISDLLKESRRKSMALGELAVRRKLVGEPELSGLIREQLLGVIMHALISEFEIVDFKVAVPRLYLPAGLSSQALILELARKSARHFEPDHGDLIVLNNGHGFADVSWYPEELSVISGLKTPKTIKELEIHTGMEHSSLCKILAVLHNLHMITTTEKTITESEAAAASKKEQLKVQLRANSDVLTQKLPLESIVPEISKTGLSDKLDVLENPASFISEQFKTLKVRLHEFAAERSAKVITVSSPYTSDGKSLVAANLGLCFAKDPNRRVLLVDCDLRNPTVHRYFGMSLAPGLHGYLSENQMEPHCYMRRIGQLFIMSAGQATTDPVELLSQDRMRNLIEALKRDFDTVLIDTPPLGLVSDAKIVSDLSDGLIMVVRSSQTTYTNIERAFKLLNREKLIGLVLNDVQARMFNTQYDYRYYHYSNRKVYPYGPEIKKKKFRSKTYFE